MSLELSRFGLDALFPKKDHCPFIKPFRLIRRGRLGKGRPFAMARVPQEGELADDKELALGIHKGTVHAAFFIIKDTETGNLLHNVVKVFIRDPSFNAQKDKKTLLDLADGFLIDTDTGA